MGQDPREGPCLDTALPQQLHKFASPEAVRTPQPVSSHRHDRSLTPFPAPRPSVENGGWVENASLLGMAWSFW